MVFSLRIFFCVSFIAVEVFAKKAPFHLFSSPFPVLFVVRRAADWFAPHRVMAEEKFVLPEELVVEM